jgi:hypothetical protein
MESLAVTFRGYDRFSPILIRPQTQPRINPIY